MKRKDGLEIRTEEDTDWGTGQTNSEDNKKWVDQTQPLFSTNPLVAAPNQ